MQEQIAQLQQQLDKIEEAIAAQEGLRGVVPDAQIEAMQVPLQEKAAELRAKQNKIAQLQQQLDKIEEAIAAQEGLRGVVPDVQIDTMQVPLQEKVAELRAKIVVVGNVTNSNLVVGNDNRAVRSNTYIEQVTIGNTISELERLQDKIRARTDDYHRLSDRASNPNAPANIVSWIKELERDLSALKGRVNAIAPNTYKPQEVTPPPRFHNPPQKSFFTGRDKYVKEVLEALEPEERTWLISVDGLGGIGKTSLIKQIAYQCESKGLFDQIIWTTAQQRLLTPAGIIKSQDQYLIELDDLLDEICWAFNYLTPLEFSFEEKVRTVKGALKQRRCLLIVDNLETLPNIKPIAAFLRKTPHPTKTITTSRKLFTVGEGERFIRLKAMSWNEGQSLIQHEQHNKGVDLSESQAEDLFALCSGIPIAITWSIGRIALSGVNVVLSDLQNHHNIGDLTEFCFESAFETLKGLSQEAAKVFLMVSLFPFPITLEAIQKISQIRNTNRLERIIQELNLLSLITRLDNNHIETLPLVRNYTKRKLGRQISLENEARQQLAKHLSAKTDKKLVHVFTPANEVIALPIDATPVDFAYAIHTSIGNRYEAATINGVLVQPTYSLKSGDQVIITAPSTSDGPKLEWARTDRATRNIKNKHRVFHRQIRQVRQGNTLSRQGRLQESIKKYEQSLRYDPTDVWTHNRLGHTLRLLGQLDRAFEAHQAALSFKPNNPFAYCGIAAINYQRGWLTEAAENYLKALQVKPDYVNALNGLGRTYCRQKDYLAAEPSFRQAIEASVQIKAQTPWLHLYFSIALLSQGVHKFTEAENSLSKALKQFSKKIAKAKQVRFQHLGTHTLYQYSIALMIGNSPKFQEILEQAVKECFARGLRDEIIADLEMINVEIWKSWTDYAVEKTSKVAYGLDPQTYIDNMRQLMV